MPLSVPQVILHRGSLSKPTKTAHYKERQCTTASVPVASPLKERLEKPMVFAHWPSSTHLRRTVSSTFYFPSDLAAITPSITPSIHHSSSTIHPNLTLPTHHTPRTTHHAHTGHKLPGLVGTPGPSPIFSTHLTTSSALAFFVFLQHILQSAKSKMEEEKIHSLYNLTTKETSTILYNNQTLLSSVISGYISCISHQLLSLIQNLRHASHILN